MNKFFRAIGFADDMTAAEVQILVGDVLANPDYRSYTTSGTEALLAEFRLKVTPCCGVSVVGEFDENDQFRFEYCYPYALNDSISTVQKFTIEPHIRQESYAAVCDDLKVGVSLIFHLVNMQDYVKKSVGQGISSEPLNCSLSALSIEGTVVLPIYKTDKEAENSRKKAVKRTRMIREAMDGDENAMQTLTMEDMDTYAAISRQILVQDVYSLVDTYFMPYGVECDMYSVLCEIESCNEIVNNLTREKLWQLQLCCNELRFITVIAQKDLYGEPAPGRRFKGVIWMQGQIFFDSAKTADTAGNL